MADLNQMYQEAEGLKAAGKFPEAIAKLEEMLAIDEGHVMSHLALAVLLGRVGQHPQAVAHAQRACELNSGDPFNFTALSVTCQRAWAGTKIQDYVKQAEDAMAKAHYLQGRK